MGTLILFTSQGLERQAIVGGRHRPMPSEITQIATTGTGYWKDAAIFSGWSAIPKFARNGLVGSLLPADVLPTYALTRICRVEYIRRMESVFEIIAEPNRRAILSLLVSSQQSVGEIGRQLRMPQPTVSKHLRVLREAGFVESTVDAQRRLYRLKPGPFRQVDAWLAQFRRFWSAHVDALERHLDRIDRRQYGSSTPTKGKTTEKTTRPKPRT
jgi:DNA-binding transcriptional ArsR family regulator